MKTGVSAELLAHVAGERTTLAVCWRIARTDGVEFFFTSNAVNLEIDGDTYEAATGTLASATAQDRGLNIDNIQATSFLSDDSITEADLAAGLFDGATVDVFFVNYMDLTMGKLWIGEGWILGPVTIRDNSFSAEIQGKIAKLQQEIVEVYSPTCRATFGDARCKVNLAALTQEAVVGSVTDSQTFVISGVTLPSGYEDMLRYGTLTWLAAESSEVANNAGLAMEIKSYDAGTGEIVLFMGMPYAVTAGDRCTVVYGCPKTMEACAMFDDPDSTSDDPTIGNTRNFRGEPYVPVEAPKNEYRRTRWIRR